MSVNKLLLTLTLGLSAQLSLAETIWLDVRSSMEYAMGHIDGAVHLPHTKVSEQAEKLLPNKDDEILVYCRSGGRAGKAEAVLKSMGYTHVKNIGGLNDAEKLKENVK